jgi:general secretion pathway protein D
MPMTETDMRPAQVLIEATIVRVRMEKKDVIDSGVNLAMLRAAGRTVDVVEDGVVTNAAIGFGPPSTLPSGGTSTGAAVQASKNTKYFWVRGSTTELIRALQGFGEIQVLACPRLLVLNRQRAEIHLGDRLGYQTYKAGSRTPTVEYINMGTQMRVRPSVASNGTVRLEVHAEHTTGSLDALGIPQINTNEVSADVMIPDGATIGMAGDVYGEVTQDPHDVPFLSRMPYVGCLFCNTIDVATKNQVIVLLAARIWKP